MKKTLYILFLLLFIASCTNTIIEEEGSINAYFCHNNPCEEIFLQTIKDSKKLRCAFYDLQLPSIQKTLKEKDAEVLVYENPHKEFTKVRSYGLMHHKFCIIDNDRVITGSMNPTHRGVNHNDNVLLIIDSHTITKNFLQEFKQLQTRKKQRTKRS